MPRQYTWYIEPIGARANKMIADMLGGDVEDSWLSGEVDVEGNKHDVWEVPRRIVRALQASREKGLKFNILVREGRRALRPWVLPG